MQVVLQSPHCHYFTLCTFISHLGKATVATIKKQNKTGKWLSGCLEMNFSKCCIQIKYIFLSLILNQMFPCNFQRVAYTAKSWWKCKSHSEAICIRGRLVISFKYWSKYFVVMFLTLVSSHQWNYLKMFGNPANHLATSVVRILKITTYKLDIQRSWVKQKFSIEQYWFEILHWLKSLPRQQSILSMKQFPS